MPSSGSPAIPGIALGDRAVHLREFTIDLSGAGLTASGVIDALRAEGIEPGVPVGEQRLLVCVTEMTSQLDIDRLAAAIAGLDGGRGSDAPRIPRPDCGPHRPPNIHHRPDPRGAERMSLPVAPKPALRRFQQASWDEPIIFELSTPGERGVLVTGIEPGVRDAVGDVVADLPAGLRRATPPALPEMGQMRVLKHYLRLSQENLGADFNVDIGQGTCTMKYAPKVNDQLVGTPALTAMHPLQNPADAQGVLEIVWNTERMIAEISGMDEVSLHTQGGSAAIWSNIAMIRAFHEANGEGEQRREVITTIFSHPSNAAAAKAAGYEVITLYPDADGYPDLAALKRALSPRTAAIMVTNPEDTGIYNPAIKEWVDAAHGVGALASYDQANANGILGITRARDAGLRRLPFQPAQDVRHAARLRRPGCRGERGECGARAVPARAASDA